MTSRIWARDLKHNEKLVALALASHAQLDGSDICVPVAKIAWMTGYSDRQVRRIMRALEQHRLLIRVADERCHEPPEYALVA